LNAVDVVVIGAGHNGLVTAGYLARAGLKVLVLERRDVVGGACVTEERFPGYRISSAAYLNSLLQQRVIQDLEMERFGYMVYPKEPAYFQPFPDGRHLIFYTFESPRCDVPPALPASSESEPEPRAPESQRGDHE